MITIVAVEAVRLLHKNSTKNIEKAVDEAGLNNYIKR